MQAGTITGTRSCSRTSRAGADHAFGRRPHHHVDYSYRDNGRGPDLKEVFALDDDGTLARYSGLGKSTFDAPIDETFDPRRRSGKWKSAADQEACHRRPGGISARRTFAGSARADRPGGGIAAGTAAGGLAGGQLAVEKLAEERFESGGSVREMSPV